MELITGIISLVALIVFFVMASQISNIRQRIYEIQVQLHKIITKKGIEFSCTCCGHKSTIQNEFCSVCKKNIYGKTLKELEEEYSMTGKVSSPETQQEHKK